MRRGLIPGLVLALVIGTASQAQDPLPLIDRQVQDALLYKTLKEVINRGAALYNKGDAAGCYRVFEGSLTTVKPLLDHRPELQKTIDKALTAAQQDPLTWRRAFTLRDALDKVRAGIKGKDPEKGTIPDKVTIPDKEEKKTDNGKGKKVIDLKDDKKGRTEDEDPDKKDKKTIEEDKKPKDEKKPKDPDDDKKKDPDEKKKDPDEKKKDPDDDKKDLAFQVRNLRLPREVK